MPAKHRQKLKLLYLAQFFAVETDEEHPVTLERIRKHLADRGIDCERRTLYDDIRLLQDYGMDIIGEKKKQYVYYLASREFELAELKLLADTVAAARFITGRKSRQLIKKIASLTSRHLAGQLDRQVYVTGRVKAQNESIYYNVDAIHRGINENRQISFHYFGYDLAKNRVKRRQGERYHVSPYILSWDNENYYMVAHYSRYEGLSHFRVDKMAELQVEEEPRQPLGKELDPGAYCQSVFGMYSGEAALVKVRFDADLVGVVIDRFGKGVSLSRVDGRSFEANLHVAVSPVFLSWLFQFGEKAEVLSPAPVRAQMKAHLEAVMGKYAAQDI